MHGQFSICSGFTNFADIFYLWKCCCNLRRKKVCRRGIKKKPYEKPEQEMQKKETPPKNRGKRTGLL